MNYIKKVTDELFHVGTRESQLLAGRILVAQAASNTVAWKFMLIEARENKWPWPDLDETPESWEVKRKIFKLQEVFRIPPFLPISMHWRNRI